MAALDEDALDAAASPGQADDVRIERAKLALARRALRELELTRDQRMQVKQARNAALSAIASIEQAEEQEAARIQEARKRKAAEAKRKADARLDAILDAAEKTAGERGELLAGTGGTRKNMRRQALRHVDEVVKGLGKKGSQARPLEPFDPVAFLTSLQGTMNQFGGNLHAAGSLQVAGAPNPEQFQMVTELREQTSVLVRLASGMRHPGTRFARNEIAAAFDGPTF